MSPKIPDSLLKRIHQLVGPRCGYCRTSSKIIGQPLTVEHILPTARGGTSDEQNLWLSCRRCNEFKRDQVEATDPETGAIVPLFNPRTQPWHEHFAWTASGTHIIGRTPIGRATVVALKLNNDEIVQARLFWVNVGWHPPLDG